MRRALIKRIAILVFIIMIVQSGLLIAASADYNGEPTYLKTIDGVEYEFKEFKSSGTFIVPSYVSQVDVTVVGGGAKGTKGDDYGGDSDYYREVYGGGGGGGGYVTNSYNVAVTAESQISIVIGAGGTSANGGQSKFGSIVANGGIQYVPVSTGYNGGNGGSGGGSGHYKSVGAGNGGSNGSVGGGSLGGVGQGSSTIGVNGTQYAGGGGGGGKSDSHGNGGAGGGGAGGYQALNGTLYDAIAGTANTGGGGGGGRGTLYSDTVGANGGSGIVVVRWLANQKPVVNITTPLSNSTYSELPGFNELTLAGTVTDPNTNDDIFIKYKVDNGEERNLQGTYITNQSFGPQPIDVTALSEGNHTLNVWAVDQLGAISDTRQIPFKVDKSAPILGTATFTSTVSSVTISGSADGSIAGLDASPYRYTVSTIGPTDWLPSSETSHEVGELSLNTQYTATFEARDAVGHISSEPKNIYTLAEVPEATVSNEASYSLDVNVVDENPDYTEYQIEVDGGANYVTPEGTLTSSPVWVKIPSKNITVQGLTPETNYTFQIKARNGDEIETEWGSPVSGTTLMSPPGSPANITTTATDTIINISWDALEDATSYEVEADGGEPVNVGIETTYEHTGLNPNTPHTYRIRGMNDGGPGNWSQQISRTTLPSKPDIPLNLTAIPLSTSVMVTWDNVPGATGYDIMVDPDNLADLNDPANDDNIKNRGPNTSYSHTSLTPGTEHTYLVRSINAGDKSDWSDPVTVTTEVDSIMVPANIDAVPSKYQITVTWDPVEGATGYDIEIDNVITIDNRSRTTYTHSNLTPATDHMYRVRAKRNGSLSDWSSMIIATTLEDEFGVPENLTAYAEDTSVSLEWDEVTNAVSYEVEIDGEVIDMGTRTSCIHDGLEPGSTHEYRVRATSGDSSISDWSELVSETTFALPIPKNLTTTETETTIKAVWEEVYAAESYEIEFDGSIIEGIVGAEYTFDGLEPGTQHTLSVRARNNEDISNWSKPVNQSTKRNGYDVPFISAIVEKDLVVIMWSPMSGAIGYDLEVDGALIENISGTSYSHTGLEPGTQHTYRVRVRDDSGSGIWSNAFTTLTMSNTPAVPTNVTASSDMTSIIITWDKIAGAEGYELETDGVLIDIGTGSNYLHSGLSPDTAHAYRVRARNLGGYSEWSELISKSTVSSLQTYNIDCTTGEEFNLLLSAANIQEVYNYTFIVRYNAEDFDIVDLCSLTSKIDTSTGSITGTDIKVTQYEPGTIVFTRTSSTRSNEVWSGVVNSIKFKAKKDGQLTITYSIN